MIAPPTSVNAISTGETGLGAKVHMLLTKHSMQCRRLLETLGIGAVMHRLCSSIIVVQGL